MKEKIIEATADSWFKCRFCGIHSPAEIGKMYEVRPVGILIGECDHCEKIANQLRQQTLNEVVESVEEYKNKAEHPLMKETIEFVIDLIHSLKEDKE